MCERTRAQGRCHSAREEGLCVSVGKRDALRRLSELRATRLVSARSGLEQLGLGSSPMIEVERKKGRLMVHVPALRVGFVIKDELSGCGASRLERSRSSMMKRSCARLKLPHGQQHKKSGCGMHTTS